jgi:hypothetical protein
MKNKYTQAIDKIGKGMFLVGEEGLADAASMV